MAAAAACSVPALNIAQNEGTNPPHLLPHVVHARAVGGGHFIQLESPAEVNAMIEGFLRLHVETASSA